VDRLAAAIAKLTPGERERLADVLGSLVVRK
jgi:hypothetical protein